MGNNIAIQIAARSSLKVICSFYFGSSWVCSTTTTTITTTSIWVGAGNLQVLSPRARWGLNIATFHYVFGAFEPLLSQFPDVHSLRWVNALCTFSTTGFAATTIGVTIYNCEPIKDVIFI